MSRFVREDVLSLANTLFFYVSIEGSSLTDVMLGVMLSLIKRTRGQRREDNGSK